VSYLSVVLMLAIFVGLPGILVIWLQSRVKNPIKGQRGTEPHQNDSLASGGSSPGGSGGGYVATIRVPRDPQRYAKGMMPGGRRK